ncbi:cytoskeleton-associated protein 4-like [Megalobrama amblycephala]|uniref:cytoskeleton-associated protein 4-like n=1 Tax=Megalobrama amblycephala TaxID=75352 RepID=UPI0020146B26|nr:cytoskeleton-associated protein 4-like [Megalobrama amblycephala]
MTVKNRNKNNSNDKTAPSQQHDEAPKRSPKVAKAENAPVSSRGSGSDALKKFLSALFYLALAAGAVFASLYLHQELSDIKHANSRHEESMKKCTAAAREVEHALQQIRSMKASLEGLESTVVSARTDLESTSRAVQKGEADSRRMEDALQKLQNKLFRDLAEGIREVKDTREKDMSSLEERLAQLSRSLSESVAEFADEQSQYKSDLHELKARLEEQDGPAVHMQELASISSAVANLNTANEVAEGNMAVLREQIALVGSELQTRNREVASVSEEVGAVRTLVQSAVGALREEVSAARAIVQTASDQLQILNNRQDQSSTALQSLEAQLREELLKLEKRRDDLEVRLKAAEESQEVSASSLSEQTNRLNALESKYESHENSLSGYRTAAEALRDDLEAMRSRVGELQTRVAALDETQEPEQELEQEPETGTRAGSLKQEQAGKNWSRNRSRSQSRNWMLFKMKNQKVLLNSWMSETKASYWKQSCISG